MAHGIRKYIPSMYFRLTIPSDAGVVGEAPEPDIPKVTINGPDSTTVMSQVSTSNGVAPTPAIVSAVLLCWIPDT